MLKEVTHVADRSVTYVLDCHAPKAPREANSRKASMAGDRANIRGPISSLSWKANA